jgi:hypothetical protein
MRILALAFALSLVGCVDDDLSEPDPDQQALDEVDTKNNDTGQPNRDGKCDGIGDRLPGGVTNVSRKKADGNCF